jgi:hypothetical protein
MVRVISLLITLFICILSSVFGIAQELSRDGLVVLYVDNGHKECKNPALNIFGINGDTDNSGEKYKPGSNIKVTPGTTEIWYMCSSPIEVSGDNCIYPAPLKYLSSKFVLVTGNEYLLECNDRKELILSPKKK